MPTDDVHRFRSRLRNARENLQESEAVAPADKEAIHRFDTHIDGGIAVSTHYHYIHRLRVLAERSPVSLTEFGEQDYYDLRHDLRTNPEYGRGSTPLSDSTVQSYEDILVRFLRDELGHDWVDHVQRTDVDTNQVDPKETLSQEHISELVSAARYARNVALIEFLADTGARLAMVASLRVRDVDLDGERATYRPNANALGLKGAEIQPYPIIDSKASLRSYLRTTHPRPDEPNAALFHRMQDFGPIDEDDGGLNPRSIQSKLNDLKRKAGLDVPTNPHQFRHSAITRMWHEGYTKQQIQHRVHWTLDTSQWKTYVHLTAEDMNNTIFADAGEVEPDEGTSAVRHPCGNCRETLAPHHHHCPNCGEPATPEARETIDEFEEGIFEFGMNADSDEEREAARALRDVLSNPEAVSRLLGGD